VTRPPRESRADARARRAAVDDPALVLEAAARLLEVRPRAVAEVRRRLRDAGYRPELVDAAIERLVALGYLDDEAFARAWVESRDRARPRGEWALRGELRRKGVADDPITAALAERSPTAEAPAEADRAAAERLLAQRGAALLREADPRRRRAKAYALLARNGFDPEVCREAVNAWLAGPGSTPGG
jgi:regulatory protein